MNVIISKANIDTLGRHRSATRRDSIGNRIGSAVPLPPSAMSGYRSYLKNDEEWTPSTKELSHSPRSSNLSKLLLGRLMSNMTEFNEFSPLEHVRSRHGSGYNSQTNINRMSTNIP